MLKRKKIRPFFIAWASLKTLYYVLFTSLVLLEYRPWCNETDERTEIQKCEEILGFNTSNTSKISCDKIWESNWILRVFLTIFIVFLTLVEALQIYVLRLTYLKKPINYVQIIILGVTSFLVISSDPGQYQWRKRVAALTLPLLSIETLKEVTSCTVYAQVYRMLLVVIGTFFKYLASYAILIFSCAVSLWLVFSESEGFSNVRELTMKVFVMWIGEMDFNEGIKAQLETSIGFYVLELLIFLFFLFIIVVVLMNLLNGLAVYDTREIKEDADVIELKSLLSVLSFWETLLLNSPRSVGVKLWKRFFEILTDGKIHFLFDPDRYELDYILSNSDRLTLHFGWQNGKAMRNQSAELWKLGFSKKVLIRASEECLTRKEETKRNVFDRIDKLEKIIADQSVQITKKVEDLMESIKKRDV